MLGRETHSRRRALLICLTSLLTGLVCAGLLSVAVLARAPAAALPFIATVCVGAPVFAAWELPWAVGVLRGARGTAAVDDLRRQLAQLPETQHPLGL